ncbi:hypothetical protein ABZY11_01850, partial [Streptomyces sp. NPDC006510]
MDYCSSCRRTLNGALVCPGCGAYAPDIAPVGHHVHNAAPVTVKTVETWPAEPWPVPETPEQADRPDSAASLDFDSDAPRTGAGLSSDAGPAVPATQGRAARRRQLARWKKHRRRAVLASTVALVGGGLTLAVLPSRPSTGHDAQATMTPEPKATATDRADATDTDSSSVRPRTRDPQGSGTGAAPSAATGPQRSTVAVSSTVTKSTRRTAVAARPAAVTVPQPRTTPAT